MHWSIKQKSEKDFPTNHLAIFFTAFIFITPACAPEDKKDRRKGDGDAAGETKTPASTTTPASGTSPETSEGEGESEASDGESDESSDEQIKALLADCGATEIDSSDLNKVIYEKTLKSFLGSKQVLLITVKVQTELNITVTGNETKQDSNVEVKEVSGLFSGLAKAEAEKQAKDNSGLAVLTNIPVSDYSTLSEKEGWKGVVCTFVPATKIVNNRGEKKTVVSFDPPLPSSISPKATAGRYSEEIGKKRVFDDIKATITESDHPALASKKSVTGSVTVEKVEATTEVDDGAGGKKSIKADLAYRITSNFGTPEMTYALGVAPVVTYYINHEKRDLVANIVDTSTAGGMAATFIHD